MDEMYRTIVEILPDVVVPLDLFSQVGGCSFVDVEIVDFFVMFV